MEHSQRIATLRVMYCWMRYSATRALTWQRSYNTQPRQLTGAQDGLSQCLASAHHKAKSAEERWYIRGMLG
jgi:alpha-glucan,water dikinase